MNLIRLLRASWRVGRYRRALVRDAEATAKLELMIIRNPKAKAAGEFVDLVALERDARAIAREVVGEFIRESITKRAPISPHEMRQEVSRRAQATVREGSVKRLDWG
jgi:hypothetical protein